MQFGMIPSNFRFRGVMFNFSLPHMLEEVCNEGHGDHPKDHLLAKFILRLVCDTAYILHSWTVMNFHTL